MAAAPTISDVLKQLTVHYKDLVNDAEQFFEEFDRVYLLYNKETKRLNEAHKQLTTIVSFKEKNGYFPQIKDQDDTAVYVAELQNIVDKAQEKVDIVEPKILGGYRRRAIMIDNIADVIIENTLNEKDANKFITTMVLRAPLPMDHRRCPNNEKNKPIYIAAWLVCFIQKLISKKMIDDEFILSKVPMMVPNEDNEALLQPHPEMQKEFIRDVIKPIVTAALIHQIGSFSSEADSYFKGNRYRLLDESERKALVKVIYENTLKYLKYGIGEPDKAAFDIQQADDYQLAMSRYTLTEAILENYLKSNSAMGNLLRIPVIYSSFLMSTKPKHEFTVLYKAYDILKSGIDKEVIYPPFARQFLAMVGRYPMGCGIYFMSKESGHPEKAIVVGMNPPEPTSAIVKQTTRRQLKYDDYSQALVTYEYNLFNEDARKNSDFGEAFFKKQFGKGYFFNPAEMWEIELNQDSFWRRDNSLRKN